MRMYKFNNIKVGEQVGFVFLKDLIKDNKMSMSKVVKKSMEIGKDGDYIYIVSIMKNDKYYHPMVVISKDSKGDVYLKDDITAIIKL